MKYNKLKKLLPLAMFLVASGAIAESALPRSLAECQSHFNGFKGDQFDPKIVQACFSFCAKSSGARVTYGFGAVKVMSCGAMLYSNPSTDVTISDWLSVGDRAEQRLLAGARTMLEEVTDVTHFEKGNEMAVLSEKGKSISFYPVDIFGNLPPNRILRSDALTGASGLAEVSGTDRVAVTKVKSILFFKFDVKPINGLLFFKADPVAEIRGARTGLVSPGSVFYDRKREHIVVYEPNRKEVLVFSAKEFGDVAPLRRIDVSGSEVVGNAKLTMDLETQDLVFVHSKGAVTIVPGSAN